MICKANLRWLCFRGGILVVISGLFAACGGGGGGGGGGGDTGGGPPPPDPVTSSYEVSLSAGDVVTGSDTAGSGSATLVFDEDAGEIEVTVTLSDLAADAVTLRSGYAGAVGAERYALAPGASSGEWLLDPQAVTATDIADLEAGALYLLATTESMPDGALRGQVLPEGVSVERIDLSAEQVRAGSDTTGTARAWATVDDNSNSITLHLVASGLDDADSAVAGRGMAGTDGSVLAPLARDTGDVTHWMLDTTAITADMQAATDNAEFYLQISTPAFPDGAVRGQWLPDGTELLVSDLTTDAVVMATTNATIAGIAGRMMTTLDSEFMTAHLNLYNVPDADAVQLRQAPAGQNGPELEDFEQDINDANHWMLEALAISAAVQAGLDNQTLYVNVTTPGAPEGAARAQIETESSSQASDPSAFLVESIEPQNASKVTALPDTVRATLNRAPLALSVTPQAVVFEASGGDGSFGDGNESTIAPASVIANGNVVEISLEGISAASDVYRVSLVGGGAAGIVDDAGIALDGDNDGEPGGVYESAFELELPVSEATLTKIQDEIFTPSCATSGCHSGFNPPDGLDLSDGASYSNTVNRGALQNAQLYLVEPGNPDDSYLVRKIRGTDIIGSRMPLGASPLTQEQIDLIVQWVTEGALDN